MFRVSFFALLLPFVLLPVEVNKPDDFNTQIVAKLGILLKATPPAKLKIEVVSQDALQGDYRGYVVEDCLRQTRNPDYCGQQVSNTHVFIHGMWIPESPQYLHIKLHERAGVDALVHEYLHWYLTYLTKPEGLLNSEQTVQIMTVQIVTSPTFLKWMEEK